MARQQKPEPENPWRECLEQLFEDAGVQELRTMASTYFQYYAVCRESGFTNAQAMQMVVAMQASFLANAYANQKGE